MTQHVTKFGLTILYCLTFSILALGQFKNQKQSGKTDPKKVDKLSFDTSKTTIIPFNKKKNRFHPFDTTYKSATLTQNEINNVDSLLLVAIAKYNNSEFKQKVYMKIDITQTTYRKQLIAATDKSGHRFVWVNNFCEIMKEYWKPIWKKQIISTADGGHCYFQFKINLDTNEIFDFFVNGYG